MLDVEVRDCQQVKEADEQRNKLKKKNILLVADHQDSV